MIGFGPTDWLECYVAALLMLSAVIWLPRFRARLGRWAERKGVMMAVLFCAPVVLRLLLLPHHPVPKPHIYDEFSHLLVADTLRHFRLANPRHPMSRFFETFFVLQQPTYSSIYPLGQGMLLVFGWSGVLLADGAFCALVYWMLLGYVEPRWALVGGALAVIEFGPLNLWTNCYWGGLLAAAAGCLVFGALPRLQQRPLYGWLLGLGFAIHMLTRQFESLLLGLSVLLFFALWRSVPRNVWYALIPIALATSLIALQNKEVTGRWTMLPEQLSQIQYGVPTTLTIESPAVPHRALTREQELEYRSQLLMHGPGRDTWKKYFARLVYRARDYRFFFLPPLYLALVVFLFTLRQRISQWVLLTLAVFGCGTNLFPYLLAHYLAGITSIFVLASILGLREISRWRIHGFSVGWEIVHVTLLLCGAQFLLWYTLHLFEGAHPPLDLMQYEAWDFIDHAETTPHDEIAQQLARIPGPLLVFVHYSPRHIFQDEWVWNAADIDASRIVWARDLGMQEDKQLMQYYPRRRVLWLEPDLNPPQLGQQP